MMMGQKTVTHADEGVSEVIGSILVFGIIIAGVAIVLLFGTNILNDSKEQNNFASVTQAYKVVQSDIKRAALEQMPVKSTRIHIDGGVASTDKSKTITIDYTGTDSSGSALGTTYNNIRVGEVHYQAGGTTNSIAMENGGLWSNEYGYDQIISPPRMYYDSANKVLVLNVIRLECNDEKFAGSGTVNLYIKSISTNVLTYTGSSGNTRIVMQTSFPRAWASWADQTFGSITGYSNAVPGTSDVTIIIPNVEKLVISEHIVHVEQMVISR